MNELMKKGNVNEFKEKGNTMSMYYFGSGDSRLSSSDADECQCSGHGGMPGKRIHS